MTELPKWLGCSLSVKEKQTNQPNNEKTNPKPKRKPNKPPEFCAYEFIDNSIPPCASSASGNIACGHL